MRSIPQYFKLFEKFTVENSPAILTGLGVVGVGTTAVLASKATVKAVDRIRNEEAFRVSEYKGEGDEPYLSNKEKVKLVAPLYISAVATGTLTATCIIFANRIGTKRAAAMAAAFTIAEKNFEDYREKVVEKLGEKKERDVRDEVAQERVTRNPPNNIVVTGKGAVPFLDSFTGIWFESSMEDVKHAINRLNHKLNHDGYASLNDFYDYLGVANTTMGNILGWDSDELLDPYITTTVTDDERPAFHMEYRKVPFDSYFRTH